MSMEAYESLTRSNEIDKAITQYESDIANHVQGKDARTLPIPKYCTKNI